MYTQVSSEICALFSSTFIWLYRGTVGIFNNSNIVHANICMNLFHSKSYHNLNAFILFIYLFIYLSIYLFIHSFIHWINYYYYFFGREDISDYHDSCFDDIGDILTSKVLSKQMLVHLFKTEPMLRLLNLSLNFKKISLLSTYISLHKFDVLCISENFLNFFFFETAFDNDNLEIGGVSLKNKTP